MTTMFSLIALALTIPWAIFALQISEPVCLSREGQLGWGPAIGVGAGTTAKASWVEENGGGKNIFCSPFLSGSWDSTSTVTVLERGSEKPLLAINDLGDAVMAWNALRTDSSVVQVSVCDHQTGVWSVPMTLSSGSGASSSPAVRISASGDAVIVWVQHFESDPCLRILASSYSKNTATWSAPSVISGASIADNSTIAMNHAGHALVAWRSFDSEQTSLQSSVYSDGLWSSPASVPVPEGSSAHMPSVGLDSFDNGTIIWQSVVPHGEPSFQFARFSQGIWSPSETLLDAFVGWGHQRFITTPSGDMMMVWTAVDGGTEVVKAMIFTGGMWAAPENISSPENDCSNVAFSMNDVGEAVAAWQNQNDEMLQVAIFSNGQWSLPQTLVSTLKCSKNYAVSLNDAGVYFVTFEVNGESQSAIYASQGVVER